MPSAFSWPIRQQTYTTPGEGFWHTIDKLVNDLGYSVLASSPNPWHTDYTTLTTGDYIVLSNPATGSPGFDIKFTYDTTLLGGADTGTVVDISPRLTVGAWGTNPVTSSTTGIYYEVGADTTPRVTLMGNDSTFIVVTEFSPEVVTINYVGRYEPFESSTYDPYPVCIGGISNTGVGYSFDVPGWVKIHDVTGTPAVWAYTDGFIWVPKHPTTAARDPLKIANVQGTLSLTHKQAPCILEFNNGAGRVDCAGRLSGVYMTAEDATTHGQVWGTEGNYVANIIGALVPWPDSTEPLQMVP